MARCVALLCNSNVGVRRIDSVYSGLMQITDEHWQKLTATGVAYLGQRHTQSAIFPGSFNPIHAGHIAMAEWAEKLLGLAVQPEISIANVDKPTLSLNVVQNRVSSVSTIGDALVTRAPKFVDKAALFPGATFVVGADTALRLDAIRYYENSEARRDEQLKLLAQYGARFLVFGRLVDNQFRDASELELSPILGALCQFVPESDFRVDISSTDIRTRN